MTIRWKQWYTKTSRLENSFAKTSIGRRSSDLVSTTRSSARRPVESKFQICLASFQKTKRDLDDRKLYRRRRVNNGHSTRPYTSKRLGHVWFSGGHVEHLTELNARQR